MRLERGLPPQAVDEENAVIGCVMMYQSSFEDACKFITGPKMFYDKRNAEIWRAVEALKLERKPADILTVKAWLESKGRLNEAGGLLRLMELTENISSNANVEYFSLLVAEAYFRRQLIEVGGKMQVVAMEKESDIATIVSKTKNWLIEAEPAVKSKRVTLAEVAGEAISETMKASKGESGSTFKMGLPGTDDYRIGVGDMIIIAGRPGMGKTAVMMHMAKHWARSGNKVLLNLLDMGPSAVAARDIASNHGISGYRMMSGDGLTADDFQKFSDYSDRCYNNISVCYAKTMDVLEREVDMLRKDHGMSDKEPVFVVSDYIQLMTAKGGGLTEQASVVSAGFKAMCKERNVVGIPLAQLSRAVENRPNKRPQLSDLRETGQLEQDADMVVFLYRPEYYQIDTYDDGSSTAGILEVMFAKTRMGTPNDAVKIGFNMGRISSLDNNEPYIPVPISVKNRQANDYEDQIGNFPY